MKVTSLTKILNISLCAVYIVLVIMYRLYNIWFSIALTLISIPTLIQSVVYKLDSKLWFGSFLMQCGVFGIVKTTLNLSMADVYPIYILIIGLSSFLVFAIFRQNIQLKVFVISFFEVLLLGIYKFAYVTLMEFWLLQIAVLMFIFTNLLVRAKINTRSN